MKKPYYLTAAIPYANADPHIGHALLHLYGDVMARYQRLSGNEVRFQCGTDEHGQKMCKTAKEKGREPAAHAKEESAKYQLLLDQWNISNDDFIRTTEERHKRGARLFWEKSFDNGDIYRKAYRGLYCYGCESFKTEKDLVNGICPEHNRAPEEVEEENYFFRLSKYQAPLKFLFEERPNFVHPQNRCREMLNILNNGLEDISVSREKSKLPWGIEVPNDDTQVIYVWFDALINYITALGYGSNNLDLFKKFWPGVNLIGKEINRFHSLLWPAMLLSAGLEPPRQIAAHGWITVEGRKMSKTVGNVIDPFKLIKEYPLEAVRYYLMREIPFDGDGNFSYEQMIKRYHGDLSNGLGNLSNRVLSMIEQYAGGKIPSVKSANYLLINFLTQKIWPEYKKHMDSWRFDLALEAVWKFVGHCDQLISDQEPWKLAKVGKISEVSDLLYHLAEALRHIAVLTWPVIPEASEKIFASLGLTVRKELGKSLAELSEWVELTVGNTVKKGAPLFPRLKS